MGWRDILKPKQQEIKKFKKLVTEKEEETSQTSQVLDGYQFKFGNQYYLDFFEERAGIAEYDGCQTISEAELIAYKDTINEWIYNNPPVDSTIYNCVYCNDNIDFDNGGFAAWGDINVCYQSSGEINHLDEYLKHRSSEAIKFLKNIGIIPPKGANT